MVQTITPVVHGGRRSRWAATLAMHVLGATISASALGLALGGAGLVLGAPWGPVGTVAVAGIAGLYALRDLTGLPVAVPDLRRQVPEWWRGWFHPTVAAFLYGLGLGVGFVTHLRHGTLVAVAAAAVTSGHPALGAMVVAPFGLARSLTVVVSRSVRDPGRQRRLGETLERLAGSAIPRMLNGAALVVVTLAALGAADTAPRGTATPIPAVALAATFAWAAAAKALRFPRWRRALAGYALPASLERLAVLGVPAAEGAVGLLILTGAVAPGAGLAAVLLAAFSVTAIRARRRGGDRLPCGCFGGEETRDVRVIVARNMLLGGLALLALTGPRVPAPTIPGSAGWLPATLALLGGGLATVAVRRTATALRQARRAGTVDGRP